MERCTVCGANDVDFHHWEYSTNRGVVLCRKCHSFIHQEDARPSKDRAWKLVAIARLVKRHYDVNGPSTVDSLMERYNIPEDYRGAVDTPSKYDSGLESYET